MLSHSRHTSDTAVIAMSRQAALLVTYLKTYLNDLERWLREWRMAINVKKSSTMLFAKAGRRIAKLPTLRGANPTGRYCPLSRGDPWYTVHLVDSHWSGEKESGTETKNAGTFPKQEKRSLHQERCSAAQAARLSFLHYACPIWWPATRSHIRKLLVLQSRCLRIAASAP